MSEEINKNEEPETPEIETEETNEPIPKRRSFFTRRNALIFSSLLAILFILLFALTIGFYRYGVFDNYIKAQFVAKLERIGMTFDADTFRVTVSPLQLQLKNAAFNDKITGEKLFFIRDAKLGLTVKNLYEWQLSRDISIDTTDIDGLEVWVKFDENGRSNFANLQFIEEDTNVNFTYSSMKFSLKNGLVHFGDLSRKIEADAKNIVFFLEPENPNIPDEEKRYKFDFTSTESNFVYDGSEITPVDIRAKGIADQKGAEISEFKLTTPIGESSLKGNLTDWKSPKYNFDITSTVDLMQTSTVLPIGTPLRGFANFSGKVSGEGEDYKIEGEVSSEALQASGVYLKAVNVNGTVAGTNSMYEANGEAVAEMLTFEDFKIDFIRLIGNVRGNGADFRWFGELQAAAAETPNGTLGGLFIRDAVAEYKEKNFSANFGNVRARRFFNEDADIQNIQANNLKINSRNGVTDVNAPTLRAENVKTKDINLQNVTARNVRVKDQGKRTEIQADNLQANAAQTEDARLKNLQASQIRIERQNGVTDVNAANLRADQVDANGATIGDVNAQNVKVRDTANEMLVYSDNLRVAKIQTDAAVLGSLNIAGVRLTIRRGVIEATSNDIDAGNVTLTRNSNLPQGGNLENVKIYKPVFILEPSGRYRASADMSLGGGVLGSIKIGAARASVTVNNDTATLKNLTADVMDGKIDGNAVIAFSNRNRSEVNVDFSNLDLGKLLALQGGRVVPIEGKTTGKANLSFAGTNFKTASGNLFADIAANAGTADRGLIPVTGRIEATAENGLFDFRTARFNTEKSELNAAGKFDLNRNNSNLNIVLDSRDAKEIDRIIRVLNISPEFERQLDDYQAEFAGNLQFRGTLTGNVNDPFINGRASLDSIILRGRELGALSSDVEVSPLNVELKNGFLRERDGGKMDFYVKIPRLGTNNIEVQATLENINTGNFLAALPLKGTLPEQFRDFQAQTSGKINLKGLPDAMEGEADITGGAGKINGEPFDGFNAKATFAGNLVNLENLNVRFGNGFLKAKGTYQTDTTDFNFTAEGKSVEFARIRPFIPNGASLSDINGVINLDAKAIGKAKDSKTYNINFEGTAKNVVYEKSSLGDLIFVGKTENQQFNANITANFEGQPQIITANINFADENLPLRAETEFNNTDLAPFIKIIRERFNQTGTVEITGRATGKVLLTGNLRQLNQKGEREWTAANLSGTATFTQFSQQIGDTPLTATETVLIRFNADEIFFDNAKFAGGGTNLVVSGSKAITNNAANNLTVAGTVNLRILNAISPNYFFSGLTNVDVRLTGTNQTARLNGSAVPQNASVAAFIGSQRFSVERISGGRILFSSNQVQIEQLSGNLGGGKVAISGGAVLTDNLRMQAFRFDFNGSNVTVPLPQDFLTTGDARLEFSGRRENNRVNSRISGRINARRSVYTKDIDLADIIGGRRSGSIEQNPGTPSDTDSFFGNPQIDLIVEGRDALVVRNNIADLTASISLRVSGDIDFPLVSGRISANSGTLFYRNDRYEIQRGELTFPPNTSIEPIINLQAEAQIKGYQVFVNLTGSLTDTENLVAAVRSNPALPQADVISLITTGNLANTEGGIPTLAQSGLNTATEILADAIINKPLSKATDKLFGLNRFEIDPIISGERLNPTARLTVGRQINRNLLITYSTNLASDQNQVIALEYRVSNRLSFVAQYEQRALSNVTRNNNVFSFEIRLRKRF